MGRVTRGSRAARPRLSVSRARLTHIGGPTVLVEVDGWTILTDPTFDGPGRKYSFGWGSSSRKLTGPAIAASALPPIDVVLLTHHQHADNLDDAGRTVLAGANVVTTTAGAAHLGDGARGLAPWATTALDAPGRPSIEITATPCRHGPPLSRAITGPVAGFALTWEGAEHGALWASGDTVLYGGVRQVADRVDVGLALLHLGAVRFGVTGPLHYTMTARDGVELCRTIDPHTIVPVHYEGWSHFTQGREGIERELASAPDVAERVRWLTIGEPTTLTV